MNQRMSKADRRDQLLSIMQTKYLEATSSAEFRIQEIAAAGNVSVVWAYELVGPEYARLREVLPGGRLRKDVVLELKAQIRELNSQIKELKESNKESFKQMVEESISQIELLDAENRLLREQVQLLKERLAESTLVRVEDEEGKDDEGENADTCGSEKELEDND